MMDNNALTHKKAASTPKYGKLLWVLMLVIIAPVPLFYLYTRGFVYLGFSREVYTDYFWFRAPWLFVHVLGGLTASLTGAVQFVPALRTRYPAWHRRIGKVYLTGIAVAAGASVYLVATATLGMVYATGLAMLSIVWVSTSAMAFIAIKKGNIQVHREWMIKSYVLTLSFVCFRFVEDLLARMGIGEFIERKILMAWASWAIPFFVTVLVLQIRRLSQSARSPIHNF